MEYNGKFGHNLGRIQHIAFMSIIYICCTDCCLETQTVAPTILGFQGLKRCIQYLDSHPRKAIFSTSNYYLVSNVIRLTWS